MLGLGAGAAAKSPKQPSFVSYLTPEEVDVKEKEPAQKDDIPFLPGELLLCEANTVLKYTQDEGSQRGVYGKLICTNFKITFLCEEGAEDNTLQGKYRLFFNVEPYASQEDVVQAEFAAHVSSAISAVLAEIPRFSGKRKRKSKVLETRVSVSNADPQVPLRLEDKNSRSEEVFPVPDRAKEIIEQEWEKPGVFFTSSPVFKKMFPVDSSITKVWSSVPKVEGAISTLAKRTTIPVVDSWAFKDPMDKKMEAYLKKMYAHLGLQWQPVVCIATVTSATSYWFEALTDSLHEETPLDEIQDRIRALSSQNILEGSRSPSSGGPVKGDSSGPLSGRHSNLGSFLSKGSISHGDVSVLTPVSWLEVKCGKWSSLVPATRVVFLGTVIDSVLMKKFLMETRTVKLLSACRVLQETPRPSVAQCMEVIELMVAAMDIVPFSRFHLRALQLCMLNHWNRDYLDLSPKIVLDQKTKDSLHWWLSRGTCFRRPSWLIVTIDVSLVVYDDKKKLLTSGQVKKNPERLIIYCKDFRVFHFCLRYTKEEEVRRIVNGIIHHIQSPKLLKLLFLFSYSAAAPRYKATCTKETTVMFESIKDWRLELERTKGNLNYKVVSVNELYTLSERLPKYFVVPVSLSEDSMFQFKGRGIPIWCWSCHNGSALLKMASLPREVDDVTMQQQRSFLEGIERTLHRPPYEEVRTEDLSSCLPSLSEIQLAYSRFKQLFLIENATDFWDTDVKWFSLLDASNWLEIIRQCLKKAIDVIDYLENQKLNVVLKEDTGSDMCCVISSLVQIMIDPYFRTQLGFQSLIQKDWIMGGHCFLDRCNHLRKNENEAPVFLLFLDCVWQLVQQYPLAFQFTETYLTVLSDSINIPIFSTFFFNSPCQRDEHSWAMDGMDKQNMPLTFYTVWDWSVQFELKALSFLNNPLYVEKPKQDKSLRKAVRLKHQRQLSLPLTHSKTPNKRGFFRDETGPFIKNLLGKRISKLISASDDVPNNGREFYESWHRKPVDFHGLILPHVDGPEIRIWAQRHLRWIPEAQVLGGGNVATMQRVLEITDELQSLKKKLEENPSMHQHSIKETEVDTRRKKSVRRSSLYPFATLSISSFRPAIATSTWHSWEAEDDLVNREDEIVDLGTI
ncbi:myotubularin-related protein 12 [Bombina bombina]|uniref:myotubularin-related protein 12 n=1 Tax=Bombina bombina TaxID=8345 RepID=UPI00235A489A|nr:myotubularin-related protein 12 [Bombina bombina]